MSERRRPHRLGVLVRDDALGLGADGGLFDPRRGVHVHFAAAHSAPVEGLERRQSGVDGGRCQPLAHKVVYEPLDVLGRYVAEAFVTEHRNGA